MDKKITICKIEDKDIDAYAWQLTEKIRTADKKEIEIQQMDTYFAIYESIAVSTETYAAKGESGELLMIFGFVEEKHTIWALGTEDVEHYHREFVKYGMGYIEKCKKKYHYMENYIHKDNKKALWYIKHAGAVFVDEIDVNGETFLKFRIGGKPCVQP